MSIQRWHDDGRCFRDPEGEWVTYNDHMAEVQELRNQLLKQHHLYYRQLWEDAVNACITAVEAMDIHECHRTKRILDCNCIGTQVIAALREVQP